MPPPRINPLGYGYDASGAGDGQCSTGQHWDEDLQDCVDGEDPNACPPGMHRDPRTDDCVRDNPDNDLGGITGPVCPTGTYPDPRTGQCIPEDNACPEGQVRNPQTGQCMPKPTGPTGPNICPDGHHWDPNTNQCVRDGDNPEPPEPPEGKCIPPLVMSNGKCVDPNTGTQCTPPLVPGPNGTCVNPNNCVPPQVQNEAGECVDPTTPEPCTPPLVRQNGRCVPPTQVCEDGEYWDQVQGTCLPHEPCPEGETRNDQGQCVRQDQPCPEGQERNAAGLCIPITTTCPAGQTRDASGACVDTIVTPVTPPVIPIDAPLEHPGAFTPTKFDSEFTPTPYESKPFDSEFNATPWVDPGVGVGQFRGPGVKPLEYEQFEAPSFKKMLEDPGYQFRRDEGLNAVTNRQSSAGLARGGAAGKALARWNQDYASGEYGKVFDRAVTTHGAGRQAALDEYGASTDAWGRAMGTHRQNYQQGADQWGRTMQGHLTNVGQESDAWNRLFQTDQANNNRALTTHLTNTGQDADAWNRRFQTNQANNNSGLAAHQTNVGTYNAHISNLLELYNSQVNSGRPWYPTPPPQQT